MQEKPENTKHTGRNPDGTWKKGFCPNPGGRPRNPLKDFSLKQFNEWTDEQKQEFLNKISPIDRWKMTEGNPANDTTIKGDKDNPIPVSLLNNVRNNSNTEDTETKEED